MDRSMKLRLLSTKMAVSVDRTIQNRSAYSPAKQLQYRSNPYHEKALEVEYDGAVKSDP